jgi:hypothetical protein
MIFTIVGRERGRGLQEVKSEFYSTVGIQISSTVHQEVKLYQYSRCSGSIDNPKKA